MAELEKTIDSFVPVEVIVEHFKKDYKSGLSVGVNIMVERYGFDPQKTMDAMIKFTAWAVDERDKNEKRKGK